MDWAPVGGVPVAADDSESLGFDMVGAVEDVLCVSRCREPGCREAEDSDASKSLIRACIASINIATLAAITASMPSRASVRVQKYTGRRPRAFPVVTRRHRREEAIQPKYTIVISLLSDYVEAFCS